MGILARCCTLGLSAILITNAWAESSTPLVGEGINGYLDKGRRSPVVSISVERGDKKVTLLADAYVPNTEYSEYPILFEFFVNRKLFATQIRSKALPGPIGVDIGTDVAVPPFNYTVIGRLIHPNREFSTVIEGAVFATNLVTTLDCTLTVPATDSSSQDSDIFTEGAVTSTQPSSNQLGLSLNKAQRESGSETISAGVTLNIAADSSAQGALTYVRSGSSHIVATEGTITSASGKVTEISVANSDSSVELKCS